MTRTPRIRTRGRVWTGALLAATAAVVAAVSAPASASANASTDSSLLRVQTSAGAVGETDADAWGTTARLDANCIANPLEQRVSFVIHSESTRTTRYRVYLNHGDQDRYWDPIEPTQGPGEAPLSEWTRGTVGPFTMLFGWAPQPHERMWHQYGIGYQVQLPQGGWSDVQVVEAAHMQDGVPVSGGCDTSY